MSELFFGLGAGGWSAFAAACVIVLIIPGPTILLVVAYALSIGRTAALAVVAGVALGDLVAMTLSVIGLGALMQSSALLFSLLKWVGAAYLIWLGYTLWRAPPSVLSEAEAADPPAMSPRRIFAHAFAVTATNPKSIIFFVAFVPQFVTPGADPAPQLALMTVTFVVLAAVNAAAYGLLAERMRRMLKTPKAARLANRIGGGALMSLGVATALARRSA